RAVVARARRPDGRAEGRVLDGGQPRAVRRRRPVARPRHRAPRAGLGPPGLQPVGPHARGAEGGEAAGEGGAVGWAGAGGGSRGPWAWARAGARAWAGAREGAREGRRARGRARGTPWPRGLWVRAWPWATALA